MIARQLSFVISRRVIVDDLDTRRVSELEAVMLNKESLINKIDLSLIQANERLRRTLLFINILGFTLRFLILIIVTRTGRHGLQLNLGEREGNSAAILTAINGIITRLIRFNVDRKFHPLQYLNK